MLCQHEQILKIKSTPPLDFTHLVNKDATNHQVAQNVNPSQTTSEGGAPASSQRSENSSSHGYSIKSGDNNLLTFGNQNEPT